jgi:hypothetical protein
MIFSNQSMRNGNPQLKNNAPAMLEGFSTNEGSKNKSAKRQRRNRGEC